MSVVLTNSRNQHDMNHEEAMAVSTPILVPAAPNFRQQLIISLLEFHDKNSSVRSVKQGWKTTDEQRKALVRLESFISSSQCQFGSDEDSEERGSYSTSSSSRSNTFSFGWKRPKITESNNDHPINILCMDGGGMKGKACL